MTDLFLDVLNTSFAASWVVLAVVLARLLLKKAPRWMVCGLWMLVAARLLIGGGIVAPFSMIPSTEVIPPESLYDLSPAIHSGVAILDNTINPVYTESLRPIPGASVNPLQVWTAVFSIIWAAGMAAMAIWAILSWGRVRRQVRESIPAEGGVFLCDRIGSPFIFGLFRPKIYLPSDLGGDARDHVIAHERSHLHRRDHWWKPLGFLLLTVNWFNPAMWLAYTLLCRDIEMACDERVVRSLSMEEKKVYSSALLSCSVNHRHIAAYPLAFGEVGVKQRVKSVLHYKKPAFWVILVTVVLTAVLGLGLLTSPEGEPEPAEIRYNGVLYIQEGESVDLIPDKQQATDTLKSVLRDSTKHPTEDGQAAGLGREYAGQPVVLVGNALYLEEPGGGRWLKFQMKTPHEFLFDTLEKELDYLVSVKAVHVWEWESLPDDRRAGLRQVLQELRTTSFEPLPGDQPPGGPLSISFYQNSLTTAFNLSLSDKGSWVLHFYDPDLGSQLWQFRSAGLSAWAESYLDRAGYYDSVFAGQETTISYRTFEHDGLTLNCGIPDGWRAEEIAPARDDAYAAFRFQPEELTGWVNVYLFPEEAAIDLSSGTPSPVEFSTGVTGVKYSLYADRWEVFQLDTTRGTLVAMPDPDADWLAELGAVAEAILGSIRAYDHGEQILGVVNRLGIHLRVENVTPKGATLICTQDGTLWDNILTGSPWTLKRWTNDGWVSIMPEEAVWTSIAYLVNQNDTTRWDINWSLIVGELGPGRYRVGKDLQGRPEPSGHTGRGGRIHPADLLRGIYH